MSSLSQPDEVYYPTPLDGDLQWLCCFKGYYYLHSTIVKELCMLCVQTGEYYTCHIKPNPEDKIIHEYDAPHKREVYDIQYQRHLIDWDDGDVSLDDVKLQMSTVVNKNCTTWRNILNKILVFMTYKHFVYPK